MSKSQNKRLAIQAKQEPVKRPDWYTSSLSEQMSLALDEEKPGWSDADVCFAIAQRLERTGYRIILAADYDRNIKALREAVKGLLREAVILSPTYLAAFAHEPMDAVIQGWEKARWVRALEAKKQADAALEGTQ